MPYLKSFYESPGYQAAEQRNKIAMAVAQADTALKNLAQYSISTQEMGFKREQLKFEIEKAQEARLFEIKKQAASTYADIFNSKIGVFKDVIKDNPAEAAKLFDYVGRETRNYVKNLWGIDLPDEDMMSMALPILTQGKLTFEEGMEANKIIKQMGYKDGIAWLIKNRAKPGVDYNQMFASRGVITEEAEYGQKERGLEIREKDALEKKLAALNRMLAGEDIQIEDLLIDKRLGNDYLANKTKYSTGAPREQLLQVKRGLEQQLGYPKEPLLPKNWLESTNKPKVAKGKADFKPWTWFKMSEDEYSTKKKDLLTDIAEAREKVLAGLISKEEAEKMVREANPDFYIKE